MARLHFVKKARKDNPQAGIKAGESYYWWRHAYRPKQFSKTQPKPSQMQSSGFLRTIYEIQEGMDALTAENDLESEIDSIKSQLEDLKSECEDNLSNMPEGLQEGSILNERIESLDEMIGEFDSIDASVPDDDGDFEPPEKEEDESESDYDARVDDARDEFRADQKNEILEQIKNITYNGS